MWKEENNDHSSSSWDHSPEPEYSDGQNEREMEAYTQPEQKAPPEPDNTTEHSSWDESSANWEQHTSEPQEESFQREPYYHERVKEEAHTPKSGWKKLIAACLIVSMVGGGSMGAGFGFVQHFLQKNAMQTTEESPGAIQTSAKTPVSKTNDGKTATQIIKDVKPSVVSIAIKATTTTSYFGGFVIPYEASGAGSGVIFYADNERVGIATNAHVIEGANQISVTFDEDKTVQATVVGTDPTADLAVIAVNRSDLTTAGITEITPLSFADSDGIEVGDAVIAIGNALGEGLTATDGIISATGKEINVDGKQLQVIQTNAAINPGNSGGALVNSNGDLIGINTAKAFTSSVEGMGYAIPSNVIRPIVDKLLTDGTAPRPYIGIRGSNINNSTAELYRLPVGVLIAEVIPGGSAEQAGLQAGDIITEFAGKKILSMDSLVGVLATQKVGDSVSIHVIRNGETPMDMNLMIQDANAAQTQP